MNLLEQDAKRFWAKVSKTDPQLCWLWSASTFQSGYGAFRHKGATLRAHRVAYELTYGELLSGSVVMHKCDQKKCCNPRHLEEGSQKENLQKAGKQGKMTRSIGVNSQLKFSKTILADIQERKLSQRAYGRKYGVDHSTIRRLQQGGE